MKTSLLSRWYVSASLLVLLSSMDAQEIHGIVTDSSGQ